MKLILKFLLVLIVITITSISYLSLVGIKTTKFNNQIISKIKKINNNIIIDLKEIKIVLDPFRFHLQAKTLGPKLKNKNKSIEIESIKTIIPLRSLFNEKFLLEDLEISTKTLEIKSLISFIRVIDPKPEFYVLEKIIKKGFLIADIKFNFDDKGNLKHPHFDKVRAKMGNLIDAGEAKSLQDAYAKAVRLDDDLYNQSLEAQRKSAKAEEDAKRKAAVEKAKKVRPRTATAPPSGSVKPSDLDSLLLDSINKAGVSK